MVYLLLLFILLPLLDIWLLFQIGGVVGGWNTVALVIVMGFIAAWLFKLEGRRTMREWSNALAEGRMPEEGMLGGAMLLVGGALLLAPGVITDVIGLLFLAPPSRRLIARLLRPRLTRYFKEKARHVVVTPNVRVVHFSYGSSPPEEDEADAAQLDERSPKIIDADFEVKR